MVLVLRVIFHSKILFSLYATLSSSFSVHSIRALIISALRLSKHMEPVCWTMYVVYACWMRNARAKRRLWSIPEVLLSFLWKIDQSQNLKIRKADWVVLNFRGCLRVETQAEFVFRFQNSNNDRWLTLMLEDCRWNSTVKDVLTHTKYLWMLFAKWVHAVRDPFTHTVFTQ